TIEELEAAALILAEEILDIISQVSRPQSRVLGRGAEIGGGNFVRMGHPAIASLLQRADVGRQECSGSPGPEGPDKRQTGRPRPDLTKVDLLESLPIGRPQ